MPPQNETCCARLPSFFFFRSLHRKASMDCASYPNCLIFCRPLSFCDWTSTRKGRAAAFCTWDCSILSVSLGEKARKRLRWPEWGLYSPFVRLFFHISRAGKPKSRVHGGTIIRWWSILVKGERDENKINASRFQLALKRETPVVERKKKTRHHVDSLLNVIAGVVYFLQIAYHDKESDTGSLSHMPCLHQPLNFMLCLCKPSKSTPLRQDDAYCPTWA